MALVSLWLGQWHGKGQPGISGGCGSLQSPSLPGAAASRAAGGMLVGASRVFGRAGFVLPELRSRTGQPGLLPASPQWLGGAGVVAMGGSLRGIGSRRLSPSAPTNQPTVGEAIPLPPTSLPCQQVFKEMLWPYKSHILKCPTSPLYCVLTHLVAQGSTRGCKQPIYPPPPALGLPAQLPPRSVDHGSGFAAAAFVSSRAG